MSLSFNLHYSIKTRVTVFALVIIVVSFCSLAFYASRILHTDMERLLGAQQLSTVSLVANNINQELQGRLEALKGIATRIDEHLLGQAEALQANLEERRVLQQLFNGGFFVVGIDGTAIASVPVSAGRVGINYIDSPHLAAALQAGKADISTVVIGKALQVPVFSMVAPIRDKQDKVIGALVGVVNLDKTNFLDQITANSYGKTGGYLIVSRQQRQIIMATEKSRIMESLPPVGVIPKMDRFIEGYEGSDVFVNPKGVEVLVSAKDIPAAGWYLAALLPTSEAFTPIRDMQQRMLLATLFLTLLAGGMIWWMLRRQLSPILSATKALGQLPDANTTSQPLSVSSQDEVGELIRAFNRLLETLRQREEALRDSEFRWKFAIEGAGDGLWDWNVANSTVFFSERWKEMFGYAKDEIGNGLAEWESRVHPDDKAAAHDAVQAYLDGRTTKYVNEHRVRCRDGGYKWILDRGMVVARGEDGRPLRMIGTHADISERKRAENELFELAERYRLANKATNDVIWDWDAIQDTQRWNEAGTAVFGWTEIVEHTVSAHWWVERVHPDDQERVHESFFQVVNNPACNVWHDEYRFLKTDGTYAVVMDRGCVQRNEHGKAIRMIGAMQDITERKRTEAELEQHRHHLEKLVLERTHQLEAARMAAEAASRAKSTFLANMSHELRTPMNGVMGMVDMALRRATDPQQIDWLNKSKSSAQHLLAVINDILDISKIEADRLTLETIHFKFDEVLESLFSLLGHKAEEKQIKLLADLGPDVSHQAFLGDPLRLSQILLNLAGNALKFTDHGSITIRARLLDDSPDGVQLRVEIADTGIGIAPEDQERLFTAFEQADGSMTRKYGGTGLGLVISKRLVHLMGGEIGVNSTLGQGSTFWFTVRLGKSTEAAPPAPIFSGKSANERLLDEYAGTRILLAEDEPINQDVSRSLLEDAGLVVDLAEDGLQAVALAKQNTYALILMDMQMPHLNGVDATMAIRALPHYAQTPILAMTANAFDEDRQVCLDAGMNDHIAKPVEPSRLYEILLAWLEKRGN